LIELLADDKNNFIVFDLKGITGTFVMDLFKFNHLDGFYLHDFSHVSFQRIVQGPDPF
jgi:hypothetical protein